MANGPARTYHPPRGTPLPLPPVRLLRRGKASARVPSQVGAWLQLAFGAVDAGPGALPTAAAECDEDGVAASVGCAEETKTVDRIKIRKRASKSYVTSLLRANIRPNVLFNHT